MIFFLLKSVNQIEFLLKLQKKKKTKTTYMKINVNID